jgi:hypothetical protein
VLNAVIVVSMDWVLVTSYRISQLLQVDVLYLQTDSGYSLGDYIVYISHSPWEKTHYSDCTLEQYKIPKACQIDTEVEELQD